MTKLRAGRFGVRIPAGGKRVSSSPKRPDRLWGPPSVLLIWHGSSFPGVKRRGHDVDPYPHTELRLNMSARGALSPFDTFVARTGTLPS